MGVYTTQATHNALLRRVDWRFLLPRPTVEKSVCFAGGAIAEALKLVSDQVTAPECAQAYGCDLAVAINPRAECLTEAWKRLRPGGALYVELQPATIAGKRPANLLKQAGFADISFYRPWPALEHPDCWVPINSRAARHYLFLRQGGRGSLAGRCKGALRGRLDLARFRFSSRLPLCVIARKPPDRPAADGLEEIVRENWPRPNHPAAPRSLSCLLLTLGRRSFSKVVILFFQEPDSAPAVAVKLARVPESETALRREADNLDSVLSALGGAPRGVPRVLFRTGRYGASAFGETAFQGAPLFTQLDKTSYRDLAFKATDWLLTRLAPGRVVSREECWNRLVEPAVVDFERCYGAVARPELLTRSRDALSRLGHLPLTVEQRDFSPWNILVNAEGELGVLDWESARMEGLPMLDLIYFLAHLAFFLDDAHSIDTRSRSYRLASDPASFTGAIHAECCRAYAAALKLCPADLHRLRLLTWMTHSRSEYDDLAAERSAPSARALRNGLFFNLWRQEMERSEAALG